ncbi:MAG: sugar ABC transporter permease [Anaerolineae bacterium]|jgi:multiple sugar transport system permease protein|nr:sugar ABC transporter permease [Chloroflexota bacterium]MBN8635073.1 sugar ABC transporter permease [Anaerolineae bacterium]
MSRLGNNQALLGYLFILPSLIGFIAFFAVPAVRSVFISFQEWNLLTDAKYVGLENYQELFADDRFWRSLQITVTYVLWNIPLQTVLALGIALLMERISNSPLLRGILILPWLMPNVIVAMLFVWLLDPTLGLINIFLQNIGIGQQGFFGSPDQAIASVAGVNIWRHMGYTAILIYAGLKTIPKSLYEAARVDGANGLVQFLRITLPLLRPVLVFVLVTSVIGSFQIFDTIAVATEGGPAGATRTIIVYIYEQVFERRINMGMATAASVVLFLILVTVTIVQIRSFRGNQSDLADYS